MMGITSKHRHRRRTTGGGKRWRKRNAHTERHELKFGLPKQGQNWNKFRKEKTYEEEKRSESTEEPAASEHGN